MEKENQNLPQARQLGLVNIVRITPFIEDQKLVEFLKQMHIPQKIAARFTAQLQCERNGKNFPAIGCRNPTGNWEIIGPAGNGYTGPLSFTHRDSHEPRIDLFNNQLDFLSVQKLQDSKLGPNDSLIVANMDQLMEALPNIKKYAQLNLYFDHTKQGDALRNCTSLLFSGRAKDFGKMYEKNISFTDYCLEIGNKERRDLAHKKSKGI
ncbi:hypothetical protein SIO70_26400 [Chitinophaga sancti]|uniref:hypothetical protein n=1 Tax=Chitinophaga sancti TaxID=1004 RepID=UPI002A75E1EB|nr:hypothetical protein [Chitinophaga sancti]WPQ61897.1 hypothetical protein SIO70_26400 [Chitinophaga sancti]